MIPLFIRVSTVAQKYLPNVSLLLILQIRTLCFPYKAKGKLVENETEENITHVNTKGLGANSLLCFMLNRKTTVIP